jgi:hypothetical protein
MPYAAACRRANCRNSYWIRRGRSIARVPQRQRKRSAHTSNYVLARAFKNSCDRGVRVKFAKIVFLVAGIYGLLILAPIYFMEGRIGRDTPPAITHPEYFYGFLGAGLAWQVLFLVLSGDPLRYRAMILPSVLEKISYGIALVVLYSQQRLALSVLAIGSVDWVFAFLFLAAYFTTKPVGYSV